MSTHRRPFPALPLPSIFRLFLAVVLVLASAAAFFATRRSLATADALGQHALESTAFALAASVEGALGERKGASELRGILADRVVAYALIAGEDGVVRFHVNPDLVGTTLPTPELRRWQHPERPAGRRITLGLGTPAYEYDYPLHARRGEPETLRIVLHLGAIDRLGTEARRLWAMVGGVLALLVAAGFALERMFTRMLVLRGEMDRRESLSLIGQMTATLAHEIRNALWGVKGYAQWLDEKLPEGSTGKPDVAAILEGTGRIEGLVDDLLLFAREETYRLEPVSLKPLAEETSASVVAGWAGTVEIPVDPTLIAMADREKLRGVLVNGIRNALDAMGESGVLTLRGEASRGSLGISVEDTGGGVSPEDLQKLFTPFFTTKTNGTGLGLAYSKKVVEGMGGSVSLENGTRGAVLQLRLPKAKEGSGG